VVQRLHEFLLVSAVIAVVGRTVIREAGKDLDFLTLESDIKRVLFGLLVQLCAWREIRPSFVALGEDFEEAVRFPQRS
jgi:hypothetical protein